LSRCDTGRHDDSIAALGKRFGAYDKGEVRVTGESNARHGEGGPWLGPGTQWAPIAIVRGRRRISGEWLERTLCHGTNILTPNEVADK